LIPQPAGGRLRRCSNPEVGGLVERLTDCAACGKWQSRTGLPPPPPPVLRRMELPCLHEGLTAPPPVGKSVSRSYLHCDAGKGVVCRCNCNTKCDLYEADGDTE
jgi:hypothetical protein